MAMNCHDRALTCVRRLDSAVAAAYLAVRRRERPALRALLFHGLFADQREAANGDADPQQATTVADLDAVLAHFRVAGYAFVSPEQVAAGLDPRGYHAMVTFDDGYANNLRALPVLARHGAVATFYVSSGHVADGRCFWWDVLHRERRARGAAPAAVAREGAALKALPPAEIRRRLAAEFGAASFDPRGEADRPLTAEELRALAAHPSARVGNHTADHAILTVIDPADARRELAEAQSWLAGQTGAAPVSVAYPNGDVDARVVAAARDVGLSVGVTTDPRPNVPPAADHPDAMMIGRFTVRGGGPARVARECRTYRSDVSTYHHLRAAGRAIAGGLRHVRGGGRSTAATPAAVTTT